MKVVFFGSTEYSVEILKKLKELNHRLIVFCPPDKRKGRHLRLSPSPVKLFCLENEIEFFQPQDINSQQNLEILKKFSPDIFLVCEYGQIFGKEILKIPKILPINIHLSLLPKYRGAAPVNWAIIKGETQTGITFHRITLKVDAGEIIYQEKFPIEVKESSLSLHSKLIKRVTQILPHFLESLEKGNFRLIPQDEKEASYAPRLKKEDGLIDWYDTNINIFNKIRGLLPWPTAFSYLETGLLIKFFKADLSNENFKDFSPSQIVEVKKDSFKIKCGKGNIEILELQPASKRVMTAKEFICGYRIKPGLKFIGKNIQD